MKAIKEMKKNEHAVSPIVATLVLIVVAVVGAVAVGTIMGTFSSDVAKENNAGDVGSASATEVLIAGSTTVKPASELLAKAYMKERSGIKITVQAGGSGAGVTSAAKGIVDIGASSEALDDAQKTAYPNLKVHQIGGSSVVVIVNSVHSATNATKPELIEAFGADTANPINAGSNLTGIVKAFHRAESSGTEDTFSVYLDPAGKKDWIDKQAENAGSILEAKTGNAGVFDAVATTPNSIGFVDFGFTKGKTGMRVLNLYDDRQYMATESNLKNANKDLVAGKTASTYYPIKLCRGLFYLTDGEPSSIVKSFITFAQSPEGMKYVNEAGMFGLAELG